MKKRAIDFGQLKTCSTNFKLMSYENELSYKCLLGLHLFLKLFVYVSVLGGGLGGALGVDGGWLPLPTRPQRYCDPASLVVRLLVSVSRLGLGLSHAHLSLHRCHA